MHVHTPLDSAHEHTIFREFQADPRIYIIIELQNALTTFKTELTPVSLLRCFLISGCLPFILFLSPQTIAADFDRPTSIKVQMFNDSFLVNKEIWLNC